jgi:hypothetical protein
VIRRLFRGTAGALAFAAVVGPASAQAAEPASTHAQEVLTEQEQASVLKYAQAEGTVSRLEAQHSSSAVAAAEQISGEKQPAVAAGPIEQAMLSTPVDVVVLHGHFVAWDVPAPAGEPTAEGTVLELVTNRLTGQVVAESLGNAPTTTPGTAAVERESMKPSSAQIAHLLQLRAKARDPRGGSGAHAASWGSPAHCDAVSNDHCYAIANWAMSNGGEKIIGSHFGVDMYPESSATPGGEQFVDQEEWVANGPDNSEAPGGWAEAGLIKSYGASGELGGAWWFYAFKNRGGILYKYLGTPYTSEQRENAWVYLGLVSIGNKEWCVSVGPNSEDIYWCDNVGYVYSKEIQDGSEMADESTPVMRGLGATGYEALSGENRIWNKATNKTENYNLEAVSSPICVANIPEAGPGDIFDGTIC